MSGNVWEWVHDISKNRNDNPETACFSTRGGGFADAMYNCKITNMEEENYDLYLSDHYLRTNPKGIRLVRTLNNEKNKIKLKR